MAEQLLRSLSPVKKDEADEFFGSLFPSVKEETKPSTIPQDEDATEPHTPGGLLQKHDPPPSLE